MSWQRSDGRIEANSRSFGARLAVLCHLLFIALISVTVACGTNEAQHSNPNGAHAKKAEVDEEVLYKSDELADEGESLLIEKRYEDAYGKFSEALQFNPENSRATFWRAILSPYLEMKGIARRVRPLYTNPKYANPKKYREVIQALNPRTPDINRHLLNGPEDIYTPEDLQEWMDRLSLKVDFMRNELKKIRKTEFLVRVPIWLGRDYFNHYVSYDCEATSYGPIPYREENCSLHDSKSFPVMIGRMELDYFIAMAGIYQANLDVLTAYRINPAALKLTETGEIQSQAEAEEQKKYLLTATAPGVLRNRDPFSRLRPAAHEVAAGLRYLLENQNEVCPAGTYSMQNRRGYLFRFGFCLNDLDIDPTRLTEADHARRTLRAFEIFLAGRPVEILIEDEVVLFDANKLFEQPPTELNIEDTIAFNKRRDISLVNAEPFAHYFHTQKDYERFTRLLKQRNSKDKFEEEEEK